MPKQTYTLSRINALVTLILLVFGFEYAAVVCTVLNPWQDCSFWALANFAVFTWSTLQGLQCYLFSVVADAGAIPDGYQHDPEDLTATYIQVKKKGGRVRHCQKCRRPKPPRAHHCSVCNACVLRMDHHCPWTNNCIGHYNYKAFLLFLSYTTLALLQASALLAWRLFALHQSLNGSRVRRTIDTALAASGALRVADATRARRALLLALLTPSALALAVPLAIGLGHLLVWHIGLVLTNKTTIEHLEGVTAHAHYRRLGQRFSHPYDLGAFQNACSVLGPQWWRWWLPGVAAQGSGVSFPSSLPATALRSLREQQQQEAQQGLFHQRGDAQPAATPIGGGSLNARQPVGAVQ